jgi:hypothetical protein
MNPPGFDQTSGSLGEDATRARPELHVCDECGSRFVYPRIVLENGEDTWELELHCPECGWTETGVFDQLAAEAFMNELEQGRDELERELAQLTTANMTEYADRFSVALAMDAIHPMDF